MLAEIVNHNELGSKSLEKVLIGGDLSDLSSHDKMIYYTSLCNSAGLNPLGRPFEYIKLNGKLTLYAKRDCTDQLRKIHGVSITILEKGVEEDCYSVTARAIDKTGRVDESTGSVSISGLKGDARSNAIMKAETKAKRRVTLSICGLGMLDESEVSSVPNVSYPLIDPPTIQTEVIDDNVIVDIISNTLSQIKSLLKEEKIQDAYLRCESLSREHKYQIWSLLDNSERYILKSYKESLLIESGEKN